MKDRCTADDGTIVCANGGPSSLPCSVCDDGPTPSLAAGEALDSCCVGDGVDVAGNYMVKAHLAATAAAKASQAAISKPERRLAGCIAAPTADPQSEVWPSEKPRQQEGAARTDVYSGRASSPNIPTATPKDRPNAVGARTPC